MEFVKREYEMFHKKNISRTSIDESFIGIKHETTNEKPTKTIELHGYWIPKTQCEICQYENISDFQKNDSLLFIVHPSSEEHFKYITQHFKYITQHYEKINIIGYPTSSQRTVLIYLNNVPYFVKLSMNVVIDGVNRMLHQNEINVSIQSSEYLKGVDIPIQIMYEPFSIIPKNNNHGMIVRKIPQNMCDYYSMFCFLGKKGITLITKLTHQFEFHSEVDFVLNFILKPLAHDYIDCLFNHGVSLQMHPQNLLMCLNHTDKFMYRDLGGCNIRNVQSKYSDNHIKDDENVIECHIIGNLCFELTRTFVHHYQSNSNDKITNWKNEMIKNNKIKSFMFDNHIFSNDEFQRYGFFELCFLEFMIDELKPFMKTIQTKSNNLIDESYFKMVKECIHGFPSFNSFGNFVSTLYQYFTL